MGDVSWSPGRIAHFAFGILSTRLTLKPHKAPSFVTIAGHYPANYVTWFMKKGPCHGETGSETSRADQSAHHRLHHDAGLAIITETFWLLCELITLIYATLRTHFGPTTPPTVSSAEVTDRRQTRRIIVAEAGELQPADKPATHKQVRLPWRTVDVHHQDNVLLG